MKRFHLYLSQQQRKRLDAESRKTGIPVAELIRRKIDEGELLGALRAQDERERLAGVKCGIPWEEHGCDWPDAVADEILRLKNLIAKYR